MIFSETEIDIDLLNDLMNEGDGRGKRTIRLF